MSLLAAVRAWCCWRERCVTRPNPKFSIWRVRFSEEYALTVEIDSPWRQELSEKNKSLSAVVRRLERTAVS